MKLDDMGDGETMRVVIVPENIFERIACEVFAALAFHAVRRSTFSREKGVWHFCIYIVALKD